MGVTRQYLRFKPTASFGLIGSTKGGLTTVPTKKNLVAAAAAENINIWNLKTGEKVLTLTSGERHEVSCISVDQTGKTLAAGYEDGSLRLFDIDTGECNVTLNGHKSGISSLAFDQAGHRLASGSKDTCVIVWDVINESGLYRLKGHKGPVTRVAFMPSRPNILVSSSKDTFVKFWDLTVQHCFKTLAGHVTEVWDFSIVRNDNYLVTGSSDAELRVWKLTFRSPDTDGTTHIEPNLKKLKIDGGDEESEKEEDDFDAGLLKIDRIGSVLRQSQDRVSHIIVDSTGRLLVCHGSDNTVETFLICNDDEVKKRLQKKAKKERKKVAKASCEESTTSTAVGLPEPTIQEEFRRLKVVKSGGKVRHVDVAVVKDAGVISILTANNQVEEFRLNLDEKSAEPEKIRSFDHSGHRSDVRTVAFSSDNTAIISASHDSIKIWNRATVTCIRSIQSGYGLCCLFVPGDRHIVLGTKKGSLQIFDVSSATMTEEVDAHEKEIWAMHMMPDRKGFVTASADQTVKFWQFELLRFEDQKSEEGKRLSIVHTRTLQLQEDALAVKVSLDGRLIAVSLLDSTVKVFFVDSLKMFLSLYGHKLPATAIDISTDSTLIATGSADKNVKIWGLDFGDCHKSIFAHDDTVTSVQFVPNTHMFFTAGKDGKIKQWDADNFERILTLEGHINEIWSMAISPNGRYLISSGHDKTLRLWEKTHEPLVLEDERETEREKESDEQLATGDSRVIPGEQDKEAGLPSKKTAETERSAERLMEAIEVYQEYMEELSAHRSEVKRTGKDTAVPSLPVLMTIFGKDVVETAEDYMAEVIGRIKSSELEETLLVLPLDVVTSLIEIIETLLAKRLNCEVVARTFFFLIEIHFSPLTAAPHLKPLLVRVRNLAALRLKELKDSVGFNMAALRFIQHQEEEKEKIQTFLQATTKFREKRKKKKQKDRALQTAIISL